MVVSPPPADISLRTVGRTRRRRFRVVMFKKKRNNIRAREKVAEEGDDADEPGVLSTVNDKDKKPKGGTAARKKAAKKEGAASTGGAALLSFEDEEADAEVFQLKKQKHRSKTSMRAPDASRRDDDADVRAKSGGEYSMDRLRELALSQKGFDARPAEHMDPNAPVAIKLRGTLKAAEVAVPVLPARDPVPLMPPPPPRRDASAAVERPEREGFAIPDAAAIEAAKAQRERMRAARTAGPNVSETPKVGSGGETRGDSDDDPEENERVTFAAGGARDAGVLRSMPVVGTDDEEAKWEDEQLRKAMSVGGAAAVAAEAAKMKAVRGGIGADRAAVDVSAAGARALEGLRAGLSRMNASRHTAVLITSGAMTAALERLAAAGERYKYMQELRDYFRDLCGCLDSKEPLIQELEENMRRFHAERGAAAARNARDDGNDEATEAAAAFEAAQAALMRGASKEDAVAAANEAAERAAAASLIGNGGEPKLDEFGRDVNAAKAAAAQKRAAIRRDRREREASADEPLGEADDAEDAKEVALFFKGWDDVREAASHVMRDVGAEYAAIAPVKAKSEEWKGRYPTTYRDAWMSHSTPQLFAPFVRLELLSWSPLYVRSSKETVAPSIDGMSWYADLFDYGMSANAAEDDEDGNLVPTLVEKLVAPVVEHAMMKCWDPTSLTQSRRMAAVVKEMLIYLEPGKCEVMAQILISAMRRLRDAAESRCEIPSWAPVVTAASPVAANHVRRQFGVSLRCVRAAMAWYDILPAADIAAVVRDGIFDRHVAPHLRLLLARPGECLDSLERASALAPREWLAPIRGVASTLAQLVRSDPEVHGGDATANEEGKVVDPGRLVKVLAAVGDFEEAQTVAKLFGVSARDNN